MASSADRLAPLQGESPVGPASLDRWIFVFTAALFFVVALAGFVPDSIAKLGDIETGKRPAFPFELHIHAVLMGAWLSLLLGQSVLMATGNTRYHRTLGTAAFALIPAILVSILFVIPAMYAQVWNALPGASPEDHERLRKVLTAKNNVVLSQFRSAGLFALFSILALRARKADSGYHKRMMIFATLVLMGAAINRIPGLPSTMPVSPLSLDLWGMAMILPLLVWDFVRSGRMHRAFVTGFAVWLPVSFVVHFAWGTAWWQAFAPRLLGYG